jgi:hypothetical protein
VILFGLAAVRNLSFAVFERLSAVSDFFFPDDEDDDDTTALSLSLDDVDDDDDDDGVGVGVAAAVDVASLNILGFDISDVEDGMSFDDDVDAT